VGAGAAAAAACQQQQPRNSGSVAHVMLVACGLWLVAVHPNQAYQITDHCQSRSIQRPLIQLRCLPKVRYVLEYY
jgi:hypothetical protein